MGRLSDSIKFAEQMQRDYPETKREAPARTAKESSETELSKEMRRLEMAAANLGDLVVGLEPQLSFVLYDSLPEPSEAKEAADREPASPIARWAREQAEQLENIGRHLRQTRQRIAI